LGASSDHHHHWKAPNFSAGKNNSECSRILGASSDLHHHWKAPNFSAGKNNSECPRILGDEQCIFIYLDWAGARLRKCTRERKRWEMERI